MLTDQDLDYSHEPISDTQTLCGITVDEVPVGFNLEMACDCGHPNCEHPLTCPACKALLIGWAN